MASSRNLARHELIGLPVTVVSSPDPAHRGASGSVVDETLNTLVVERPSGRRCRLQKQGSRFRFSLPGGGTAELEGMDIRFRPEDRVKRCK